MRPTIKYFYSTDMFYLGIILHMGKYIFSWQIYLLRGHFAFW